MPLYLLCDALDARVPSREPRRELIAFVADRPGHDRRYAIDATKIQKELGWFPKRKFDDAIKTTIQWFKDNEPWWRAIKSGEYLKYYETQYAGR